MDEIEKTKFFSKVSKITKNRNFLVYVVFLFYCFMSVWFLGFISRYSQAKPIIETFSWFCQQPVATLINILLVAWLIRIIWLLTNRLFLATIVSSVILVIFSLIDYFKQTIRGEPFYPGDLLFSGEATNIIGATKLVIPMGAIFFLVFVLLICLAIYFIKPAKLKLKRRLIEGLIIGSIMILAFPFYFNNNNVQKAIGIEDGIWNQKYNYRQNGLMAAFLMQTSYLRVNRPAGYSANSAKQLLDKYKPSKVASQTPNVIMIMSESFWDPTRLPAVDFNIDPLESFRSIQKESFYGDVLVEPFGGNTANTEFEVLTGFSMHQLPGGVAYQQYLRREVPSLASLLKSQGYTAEAIHPYMDWFWNRKVVYPMLGFDNFLSLDDFRLEDKKGEFTSDEAVVDRIIERYKANKKTGNSYFGHIVTMQNHGWYNKDRYSNEELVIKASSDKLSQVALDEINTYSQGAKDASDSLAKLVEYFRDEEQPTEIVFFGDHLPTLGSNYGYYRSAGYIGEGDLSNEDSFKLHQVPFLIWSNYRSEAKDIGVINANLLAPLLLDKAKMVANNYFNFLSSLDDDIKACNKVVCLKGNKLVDRQPDNKGLLDQQTLQYYYLFDKNR